MKQEQEQDKEQEQEVAGAFVENAPPRYEEQLLCVRRAGTDEPYRLRLLALAARGGIRFRKRSPLWAGLGVCQGF